MFKAGALDDNLLPISITNKAIFNDSRWFPHWDEKDIEAHEYLLKPGTNKMKRMFNIEVRNFFIFNYHDL